MSVDFITDLRNRTEKCSVNVPALLRAINAGLVRPVAVGITRLGELCHSFALHPNGCFAGYNDYARFARPTAKEAIMHSEPDNVQDRNISAVFGVLDADRDGTITGADFDAIGRRVCEQFGMAADSDDGQKLTKGYHEWWSQLQRDLDIDNDGRVTFDEFVAAYKGHGDPERFFDEQLGRTAKLVAEIIDADNDGFVAEDEYMRLLAVATSDRQAALAGFRDLDTDGDGKISVTEFQAGVRRLMLSDDPTAPGTSMLGQK